MPSIDLNRYQPKKKTVKPAVEKENPLMAILGKEISFGSRELADKKKEYLYLELGSLLEAGIDIKTSLELITSDEKGKSKDLLSSILAAVVSGIPFSDALRQSGKFSAYETFSLQIGEESGKITEVLADLARYYKNKIRQQRKVISALTYPCIILATSFGAVFFMLKFVVPMFGDVFKRFGGELPWITVKIIRVSEVLENNFLLFFVVSTGVAAGLYLARNTPKFREISSRLFLRVPMAGNLVQKIYLARFCNSMRLLINADLPLLQAIALIRKMIRYYPLESSLEKVEQDILRGSSLHESLQRFAIYPPKMIQLVRVGEETNQLDHFFGRISEQYIEEVEYKTTALSNMIEPLIILLLGAVVGLILIAMYLPLLSMSNSFQ